VGGVLWGRKADPVISDLTVEKTRNGWSVVGAGVILKTFATNAQAWRWIDRHQGDIVSRSEAVSEWIATRNE
jgi:hypothetical protein